MRFVFLQNNHGNFKTKRIVDEVRKAGHEAVIVPLAEVSVKIQNTHVNVFVNDEPFPEGDVLYASLDGYNVVGWDIVEILRLQGFVLAQPCRQHFTKFEQISLLKNKGLPVPATWAVSSILSLCFAFEGKKYPLILKIMYGARGEGVHMVQSFNELRELANDYFLKNEPFIIQQVVQPLGVDVRAYVVGDEVLTAMERTAVDGDFRANISLGAEGALTSLTDDEIKLVLKAASIFEGLECCGVDFIRTENGPVFLEVNKMPDIKGIEKATGVNVAGALVAYYESMLASENK